MYLENRPHSLAYVISVAQRHLFRWMDDEEVIGLDPVSLERDLNVATEGHIRSYLRSDH